MGNHSLLLHIEGHVQGVGFRWWLARIARARGLSGWVRNQSDGSVEALLYGPAAAVEAVAMACREGPPSSFVLMVTATPTAPPGQSGFHTL